MRITGALLKVLRVLLEEPTHELYGLELSRATGVKSGTLYPLLDRLERVGWIKGRWEDVAPTEEGRPRRRFYSLTNLGAHEARQTLAEYAPGGLLWT